MGALVYLEERIKAVRNVIDNSIATISPIIEEAVLSTLLEIYSEMKVEEEILTDINNQISTNIFFLRKRRSQLNIDLIIPKCVSEEEKNLDSGVKILSTYFLREKQPSKFGLVRSVQLQF